MIKNLPANAGDIRDSGSIPGWEDPLEEDMAAHSSILAWRIPWTEEPDGLQSMGWQSWTQLSMYSTTLKITSVYFCFYFQNSGRWIIEDPAVIYV